MLCFETLLAHKFGSPSISQLSCPNDAGFVGGSDNGIAQQMQMQYMRDQLRQELQQRSFLSHAQVGLQNISHQSTVAVLASSDVSAYGSC